MAIDAHRGRKRPDFESLVAEVAPTGSVDAALLLTASGEVLSSWGPERARLEVLSVMSATMTASVDTLVEELGGHRPGQFVLEAGDHRLLSAWTRDDHLLVITAPSSVPQATFLAAAQAIEENLLAARKRRRGEAHPVAVHP